MTEITWGVPTPTFNRLRHAFKGGNSLCGQHKNCPPNVVMHGSGVRPCQKCEKAAKKMSPIRDSETGE